MPEPVVPEHRPFSIVVCSRTRPESLARCLRSLARLDYPEYEVVVVDNTDGGTLNLPAVDATVRVVREARPGLSRARNTGIGHSRHALLAFTDDDVEVEPEWLAGLAAAFADTRTDVVTGLVLPAVVETEAERVFQWMGGMEKGRVPRWYGGSQLTPAEAIDVKNVGVGANMAFRRSVFDAVGPFDEEMGVGTALLGGEDLDIFHRVLGAGLTIRYEPAAVVRHHHRRTAGELRAQYFANGCAYAGYFIKIWAHRTAPRLDVARVGLSWFITRLATALYRTLARPGLRSAVAWAEVRGALKAGSRSVRAGRVVATTGSRKV